MNNQAVWDQHYRREISRQLYPDENVVRLLRKKFSEKKCTSALDLGTGSGRHLPLLAEHFDQVFACDFSFTGLQLSSVGNIYRVQAKLPDLPFAPQSFDFILCWGVLHYLDESLLLPAMDAIEKTLKAEGSVFFTLRSDKDTHLVAQLKSGDLAGGYARLFSKEEALSLCARFNKVDYGFIARQILGEESLVAHHMIFACK